MGTVYAAEHTAIGKRLAVKVLGAEFANEEVHRRRFLREARAISSIEHENVVNVSDFGVTHNGSFYLAMELLKGEGLSDLMAREGALPWRRAKVIILQICRAIGAAHEKGILHRDIKPENAFRIKRGANRDFIKVLDFGLAKIVGNQTNMEASLTGAGRVFGTPEYMSPEQICNDTLDARSDVYSLGILLYEMVTGVPPFEGEHFTVILDQQLNALPVPPRQRVPHAGISALLDSVVIKALQKRPEDRFGSVHEFADALAAAPVPGPGQLPSGANRAQSVPAKSNDKLYLAIIAGLGAVVVFLAVAVVLLLLR